MAPDSSEGKWIVVERCGPVWSRGSMSSSLGSPKSPPPERLSDSTRWLCFQHRLFEAETGLLLDTASEQRRRPQRGGPSKPQQFNESTPDVLSRPMLFSEGLSLDCGHFWKDRTRQCCRGNSIWNNWRRGNGATPFRPTRPVGVRPTRPVRVRPTRPDPLGSARPDPTR